MEIKNYTIQEIMIRIQAGNRLICFGAGKALDVSCRLFSSVHFADYIDYVIDNRIMGNRMLVSGRCVKVIQLSEVSWTSDKTIIMITSIYADEIMMQLKGAFGTRDFDVCFYRSVYDKTLEECVLSGELDCSVYQDPNYLIPKIIHYCWFGGAKLPEQYRTWMQSWQEQCPGYEIVEWNEHNYDVRANAYMSEAYDSGKWAFVSDFARLDIVYRYGGIYLDTDVELLKPLDSLLMQSGFCGYEGLDYIATGLGFGAVKENKVIGLWREDYLNRHFRNEDGNSDMMTCPERQTNLLTKHGLNITGKFQRFMDMNIYPMTFFMSYLMFSRRVLKTKSSFSVHYYQGSWTKDMSSFYRHFLESLPN